MCTARPLRSAGARCPCTHLLCCFHHIPDFVLTRDVDRFPKAVLLAAPVSSGRPSPGGQALVEVLVGFAHGSASFVGAYVGSLKIRCTDRLSHLSCSREPGCLPLGQCVQCVGLWDTHDQSCRQLQPSMGHAPQK